MADKLLDIERLRKLWERGPEEAAPAVHPVLAGVEAAGNPAQEAGEALERMRVLALACVPEQLDALESFFVEARGLLEAHRHGETQGKPLEALKVTLNRLEDLLEVFLLLPQVKP
jgi:hypothetical protein